MEKAYTMTKKTIQIRVDRDIMHDLKKNFPGTSNNSLFKIMYHSSALKLENNLRNFDKNVKKKR